jgi:hypothetical protein
MNEKEINEARMDWIASITKHNKLARARYLTLLLDLESLRLRFQDYERFDTAEAFAEYLSNTLDVSTEHIEHILILLGGTPEMNEAAKKFAQTLESSYDRV